MQNKSNADVFIRGGQTTQHWVRMGSQVLKGSLALSALVLVAAWTYLAATYYKAENFGLMWAHFQSKFYVENHGSPDTPIRYFDPRAGWVNETAAHIYNDNFVVGTALDYEEKALEFLKIAVWPAVLAGLLTFVVYYVSGRDLEGDAHVRGTKLVSRKELKKWSREKWRAYRRKFGKDRKKAPRYTIAGIEFPPNAVEAQTVICGTVGVGKSNAIRELLATVQELNGTAIIYDRMGTFVEDFYDPERDVIINPFDKRSKAWSPFFEAERPEFFTELADVFIPDPPGQSDRFWIQSARIVFDYVAQELFKKGQLTNRKLREAILTLPAEKLAELIALTPGAHFFNQEIAKTASSIRANLIAELRFLEFLRDDAEPFSIRDWIKNDERKGFVFLTGDAEHQAATRNIISAILEVAANALMTTQQSNDPRVWFFLDEVPTLNKMPFLPKSLAQIRQFGGAFVVGYQVFSQLEDIYGQTGARTIAGNLNNRVVFNTPDADTAEIFSKALGSEDIEERRENITVGAHQSRDGVGFMAHRTERRIVTASQIQSLAQFEAYISFAYDAPTAFVRFDAYPIEGTAPKFIPYHRRDFAEGEMNSALAQSEAQDPTSANGDNSSHQQEQFETYLKHLSDAGHANYVGDPTHAEALRAHFYAERLKGKNPHEIGLPALAGQLMAGNRQKKATRPNLPAANANPTTNKSKPESGAKPVAAPQKEYALSTRADPASTNETGQNQKKPRSAQTSLFDRLEDFAGLGGTHK